MATTRDSRTTPPLPLHPVFLTALTLLVLNDHVLKQAFGNWWTGKLSDGAWVILAPLFMIAVYESVTRREATVGICVISSTLVMAALAAINTVDWAGDMYQTGLSAAQWPFRVLGSLLQGGNFPEVGQVQLTRDPSDLMMLPFGLVPVVLVLARKAQSSLIPKGFAYGSKNG